MKTYQNLNNIMHCLKVMADEEVCEECELYNLGDVYCRDVARSAIELIKKQIPMKVETVGYYKFICPVCGTEIGVVMMFCKHKNLKFIRNIHGDEINYISPIKMIYRSEWKCKDCGKIVYKGELYYER